MTYLNPEEAIKRLAASMGIETLNLIKSDEERQAEKQQAQQEAMQASLVNQVGQLAKSPIADPTKNPEALDGLKDATQSFQSGPAEG